MGRPREHARRPRSITGLRKSQQGKKSEAQPVFVNTEDGRKNLVQDKHILDFFSLVRDL